MGHFKLKKQNQKDINKLKKLIFLIILSLPWIFILSCAPEKKNQPLVKECILPEDQIATLSGKWPAVPVPLAVKAGEFSPDEIKELAGAADSWNRFTQGSMGFFALNYGDANNPNQSNAIKPSALCAQTILRGHDFTGNIVLYKHAKWPYKNKGVIALTSFCPRAVAGQKIPNISMAIMELNYQDFFVEGKLLPDLQSILLHEFGHLLGLNHSCESTKKSGFPDCRNPELPVPYLSASLFPIFSFDERGIGERRQTLNENDQSRCNCLYKEAFGADSN